MLVYRITGKKHAADLSGKGAAMFGGRWNKKGTPVLYTGESKEIALLESLVHIPPFFIPELEIVTLEIPDDSITIIDTNTLPENWKTYPAPTILGEIGQQWINEHKTVALKVPSSIIYSACNYILNVMHKDYEKIIIIKREKFEFDSRLRRD